MAAGLKAISIGNVCQRPRTVCAGNSPELSGKGVNKSVFMTFQTGNHSVCRLLPFVIIRSNEMTGFAYGRSFHQNLLKKKPGDRQEYQKAQEKNGCDLHFKQISFRIHVPQGGIEKVIAVSDAALNLKSFFYP